jgi:aryl-alcohol dehydrogenase-like predicted oxidoreductase
MKYTTLPNTEIEVSKICLGTMTFGQQNTEAEGHEQMDYALEKGVNFGTQPRCILFLHVRKPTGY